MTHRLARLLRWDIGEVETPTVIRTKDGALMAFLRVRGPDLHSALGSALVAQADQLNNILRRLDGTWMMQSESRRQEVCEYPDAEWPDPVSRLIDEERRRRFQTPGLHWETVSTLTLRWKPPSQVQIGKLARIAYKNLPRGNMRNDVPRFQEEMERFRGLLQDCLEEVVPLGSTAAGQSESLRFLHSTVSMKDHPIDWPDTPYALDYYLTDMDLERVWVPPSVIRWPKLGDYYLRCVCVKRYPKVSHPGMFEILDELTIPYRACERWKPLSYQAAVTEAKRYGGGHWGQREQGTRTNKAAVNLADQAASFQQGIEEHDFSGNYLTQTVVVWGTTFAEATDRAHQIERALNAIGCIAKVETFNTMSAWLGSLPGEAVRNTRRPLVHSRNWSHIGPWQHVSRGAAWNTHLQGHPLMTVTGRGNVPFGLDTYNDDVGHTFIIGPNGSGKSFLLQSMALAWQQYAGNVRILDKNESARVPTYAMGGGWYDLGEEIKKLAGSGHSLDDPRFKPWGTLWEPPTGTWLCFETNSLFDTPEMIPKIVEPLIRSIVSGLTGIPTMMLLDEGWRYLKELFLKGKIQDFFLTARKLNMMMVLATQSPTHITMSDIGLDIFQQCASAFFLADPKAMSPELAKHYEALDVNEREREIIAGLTPKRQYYFKGPQDSAVIDLNAGPIQRAIAGSSRKTDLALAGQLYEKDPANFAYNFLMAKNLPEAAARLEELTCAYTAS